MSWIEQTAAGLKWRRRAGLRLRLLLLHGLFGNGTHFHEAAQERCLAGLDLVAVDLPGFGGSEAVPAPVFPAMAAKLRSLVASLPEVPTVIVAHSMSSSLAARLADGAAGLVLIEGNILPQHLRISDRLVALGEAQFATELERLRRNAAMIVKWETAVSDPSRRRELADSYRQCQPEAAWCAVQAANRDVRQDQLVERLMQRPEPILCIYGSDSGYDTTLDELADLLPSMELVPILGARHFPMLDRPADTYSAIGSFMSKRVAQTC